MLRVGALPTCLMLPAYMTWMQLLHCIAVLLTSYFLFFLLFLTLGDGVPIGQHCVWYYVGLVFALWSGAVCRL